MGRRKIVAFMGSILDTRYWILDNQQLTRSEFQKHRVSSIQNLGMFSISYIPLNVLTSEPGTFEPLNAYLTAYGGTASSPDPGSTCFGSKKGFDQSIPAHVRHVPIDVTDGPAAGGRQGFIFRSHQAQQRATFVFNPLNAFRSVVELS